MATPAEIKSLRQRTVGILRSKPCMDIKFTMDNITIMGYGYGYISQMIEEENVDFSIGNVGNFTALYNSRNNTFGFKTADIGKSGDAGERGTIVHEATHAVIDATGKGRTIKYATDEVAAYLAEMIYALNCRDPINTTGPVAGPLYLLARKVLGWRGEGVYVCDPADTRPLKATIIDIYAKLAKARGEVEPTLDTNSFTDGVDPKKPAMVPDP